MGKFRLVASHPDDERLKLYRGTAMNKMEPAEIAALVGRGDQQLKSVIDIRTKEEIGDCLTYPFPEEVTYHVVQLTSAGEFVEIARSIEDHEQVCQVTVYRIDFYTMSKKLRIFSGLFWNNWRQALSGWTSDRFDTSDGWRMGVIKKLASDVAQSKGPAGLYIDWLDPAMDCSSLVALFRLLSNGSIYPAMLHCQYGKDRTGAVCALLQMMDPSMTEEQVVDEYHATETHIEQFLPEIEAKILKAKMPLESARCPKELMMEVIAWVKDRYESVENYLAEIGLQEFEVAALKACLGYTKEQQ